VRPFAAGEPSLARLNALAEARQLRTESGQPVRFVPPGTKDLYYEIRVFETGRVETRSESLHDYFNALAWLAFPRTKARINAMHAAEIPRERGRRGRLRDLLTIFDEGGAIVQCDDTVLLSLLGQSRWQELLWENRERVRAAMKALVIGHAVLEKALEPWPGITCKTIVVPAGSDPDVAAHAWLGALQPGATPRDMSPLPIYGLPGWYPGQDAEFYGDARYFRSYGEVKLQPESARQPLRASAEESPGSAERDAG
jgi:hypothetical protein